MTREQAMESPGVHTLAKDILRMSEGKDVVDRYYDVLLAANILKKEINKAMAEYTHTRR